ncbi:MAG TPA: hypothetical protein VGF28_13235 [Thermoanaerobaculia bacterium]|jgi:hypothetical protein
MPYDLAVFGGSGQWVLLELLLRKARGEHVEMPTRTWIIDPHQPDRAGTLPALVLKFETSQRLTVQRIRPKRDALRQPTFDAVLDKELDPAAAYEGLREHIEAVLTATERAYPTESGFFALPRLAASWVALAGFEHDPPFLVPKYLEEPGQLVLVGSLAGGTGAGLLPQMLLRVRAAEPAQWGKRVIVQALLPWLNPKKATGPGEKVPWEHCLRNAGDGIRALRRIMDDIKARVPAGGGVVPETLCAIAGVPPASAAASAPPDEQKVEKAGVAPRFIRVAVDSLLLLVGSQDQQNAQAAKVVIGPAPVPLQGEAAELLAEYESRDGFSAVQLRALAEEITAKHSLVAGAVSLHRGFGRVIGGLFVARSLSGFTSRSKHGSTAWQSFWDGFTGELVKRADSLDDGRGVAVSLAKDIPATLKALDALFKSDDDRAQLFMDADAQAENATAAGASIAKKLSDALIASRAQTAPNRYGYAFPTNGVLRPTHVAAGPALRNFEDDEEARNLADLYQRSTFTGFYGASYARTYGQALKLADLLRESTVQILAAQRGNKLLASLLVLWRAAIHGLLTYRSAAIDPRDRVFSRLIDHERITRDFGSSLTTVRYGNQVVGFLSLELGFIPHVAVLDDRGEHAEAEEAFRACARDLPASLDVDRLLLTALGHYATGSLQASTEVAWVKFLLSCADTPDGFDETDELERNTLPSRPIELSLNTTGDVRFVPIPLVTPAAELAALRAINWSTRAKSMFSVAPTRNEESELIFGVFDDRIPIARTSHIDGRWYIHELLSAELNDAARYVENTSGRAQAGLVVATWR